MREELHQSIYLIWWLNQGFQWYWAREGGSLKFLDGVWGGSQYGLWGNLCPPAPLFINKICVLHYLLEMPSRTSSTWGSLKPNETAQVEPKYLSKNSGNVTGTWSAIMPPAIRRSLGEHGTGRPEERRDTESVPPRLDLQLNSHSLLLSDALSAGMPLQGEGNWLQSPLLQGKGARGILWKALSLLI